MDLVAASSVLGYFSKLNVHFLESVLEKGLQRRVVRSQELLAREKVKENVECKKDTRFLELAGVVHDKTGEGKGQLLVIVEMS
jgi:hypothetical protein